MLKIFSVLDNYLGIFEKWLLILFTLTLTLIMSSQVLLRYFFSEPLFWAEEVSLQILIALSFVGVSYLAHVGQLVRVDIVLSLIKGKNNVFLSRGLHIVALFISLTLSYVGTQWLSRPEVGTDISATTSIPLWYNYALLVFSFYSLSFHLFYKAVAPIVLETESC